MQNKSEEFLIWQREEALRELFRVKVPVVNMLVYRICTVIDDGNVSSVLFCR